MENISSGGTLFFLFDTFSGFSANDTEIENERGLSNARVGEFVNTSEQHVIARMRKPDQVIVRKGYFPDTAVGLENETYKFVSMDADLYKPTLEGLRYFYPRLVDGGYIFLHDYFTEDFWGVQEAVAEFQKEHLLKFAPIGDNCTIAIIK